MTDDILTLKCLEQPWRDLGFDKIPNDHAPCPFHDSSDHFSIFKDSKGFWRFKCHNSGTSGSIIDLWAEQQGVDDAQAIAELVGHYVDNDTRLEHKEREQVERREPVYPEPTDYDAGTPDLLTSKSGQPRPGPSHGGEQLYFGDCTLIDTVSARWGECDQTIAVCRWDFGDAKVIRPFHKTPDDRYWQYGQGLDTHEKKPLHRFDELHNEPNLPVILVEGEKCVHAVEEALAAEFLDIDPFYLVTTVIGGTNSTPWTDMSLLEGREVIVFPDLDEPGALWIDKLKPKIAPFKLIWPADAPDELPESGGLDIADRLEDGVRLVTLLGRPAEWVFQDEPDEGEERDPDIFRPGYQRMTSENFANYDMREHVDANGNPKMKPVRKELSELREQLFDLTNGFPRTAAGIPFVRGPQFGRFGEQGQIRFIEDATKLHSWLEDVVPLVWEEGRMYTSAWDKTKGISVKVLLDTLTVHARHQYDLVESIPHEPKVDKIFYINEVPEGDGSHLERLCDEFNADSDIDRELLKAATITPFWGGTAGQRPAFVIRTDHGRGVGKSSTVKAIAQIFDGPIKIGANEERDQFMQRVLSDEGLKKRIIFLDNLKGGLDSGDFEDLVTARTLSGKRMYHGEMAIPNLFTWFITSNNPELSTDLASRSVVINIGPKQHNKDFDTAIKAFINDHRLEILGDIKAFLKRRAQVQLNNNTRFPSWDNAVLSRFAQGKTMVNTILRRAGEVDEEAQRADELFDMLAGWIRTQGHDPHSAHVVISSQQVQKIFQEFLAEFTVHIRTCYKYVRQYRSQPAFDGYTVEKTRTRDARGLLWVGPDAEPGTTPVVLDVA
jgi:hypothetical protein